MGSDSATKLATQQSIKAYVDAQAGGAFGAALLHVRDEQSAGSDGGSFTSGGWRTRTLNTSMTNEISGASLGSDQITLPAGTYYIEALAPSNAVIDHKAKLWNITDASNELIGLSGTGTNGSGISTVTGRFTIAGAKVFEIRHRCSNTKSTDGFGAASNFGVVEVYTDVRIWKVG